MFVAVWASTTRWVNLTQQILIAVADSSHNRKILDLMAAIRSHVGVSYELLILTQDIRSAIVQYISWDN